MDAGLLSVLGAYQSVLSQLAALDLETAHGDEIRARARWIEEGESPSAYFFRLEKKRGLDRWISALREPDGSIVSCPEDL